MAGVSQEVELRRHCTFAIHHTCFSPVMLHCWGTGERTRFSVFLRVRYFRRLVTEGISPAALLGYGGADTFLCYSAGSLFQTPRHRRDITGCIVGLRGNGHVSL
ncbi:hypothetical protein FKM82_007044 [Ascaphus truei]